MHTPSRVLYVEDDHVLAKVVCGLLGMVGLDATTVPTLGEAERQLAAGGFDVVLLDLDLPDARWPEPLDRLQRGFPDVPVVVVTGSISHDLVREAIHRGAQEVIMKPARAEQIEEAFIRAVYRHQVRKIFAPIRESMERAQDALNQATTGAEEKKQKK